MFRKEDLHIAILKYGRDKTEGGVLFQDLSTHIEKRGYDVSQERLQTYFAETYEPMDLTKRGGSYIDRAQETSTLTIESTFRLIEHEEFKNANRSSLWATVFAILAIIISIISTYKSIYYSEKQIGSDVSISQYQIDEIKTLKYDDRALAIKLDRIISNQETIIRQNKAFENMTLRQIKKANKKIQVTPKSGAPD